MRHSPRKRFGQNFLQSQAIIGNIISAINPQSQDNMLEIGPGLGALTLPLLTRLEQLSAVEIDRDLQQYWQDLQEAQGKLNLIAADALEVDYAAFGPNLRLIGNLPYNISTPLLLRMLKFTAQIQDMHFMLQKEVVERIVASAGTKAYGRLSVMLQYHCEVAQILDVPPEAFDPKPKVDSAVVRLVPYKISPYQKVNIQALESLVAKAFGMRRKTLANNLKGQVSATQLQELGIDPMKRPEQISIDDYVTMAKFVSNS